MYAEPPAIPAAFCSFYRDYRFPSSQKSRLCSKLNPTPPSAPPTGRKALARETQHNIIIPCPLRRRNAGLRRHHPVHRTHLRSSTHMDHGIRFAMTPTFSVLLDRYSLWLYHKAPAKVWFDMTEIRSSLIILYCTQ